MQDVSFAIHKKERVGLVGRNGHGKSTLFRIVLGMDTADEGLIDWPKNYIIKGLDQHSEISRATVFGEVWEDVCKQHEDDMGMDEGEEWKVEKMLMGLGFSYEDLLRNPKEFSGGFQMRLRLAKLLLSEPDLLMLDEPTNYLDIISLRWLARFLRSWKKELFLVTHDRDFMNQVTTHTMALHRLGIKKVRGDSGKLYSQIELEEETHERTRQNLIKKQAQQEKFIQEFRSGARSAGLVQSRIKMLEKQKPPKKLKKIHEIKFQFSSLEFHGNWLVELEEVAFGFEKNKILFSDLTSEIHMGDRIGIVGQNGRGKSTFLRVMEKQLEKSAGRIRWHKSLEKAYFGPYSESPLNKDNEILKELAVFYPGVPEMQLRRLAASMMFEGRMAHKKISVLSGGEQSRVQLAKMMLNPQHLLLLDEPTNHLDIESVEALSDALIAYEGASIFVSHNQRFLSLVANKLLVFDDNGARLFNGTYDEFLKDDGWGEEMDADMGEKIVSSPEAPSGLVETVDKGLTEKERKYLEREQKKRIRSIQGKLKKAEKEIETLEEKMVFNKEKLEKALHRGERLKVNDCAEEAENINKALGEAYKRWEKIEKEME